MDSSGSPAASLLAALREALAASPSAPAIGAGRPVAVGFSGGLDSSALLHAAVECFGSDGVLALHVNHGLQPAADDWQAHCRTVARHLGCRFDCARLAAPLVHPAGGIEAWARDARRAALIDACHRHGAGLLMLGHHADDQVETVLLNWGRGCGLNGMQGMSPITQQHGVPIVRPWLHLARGKLLDYARHRHLTVLDDPSNALARYRRNRVRHELLPVLDDVFPGFRSNVLRHAQLVREARQASGAVVQLPLPGFDRRVLRSCDAVSGEASLRDWIARHGLRPPGRARSRHLREQLLESAGASAQVLHDGRLLRRYRDFVSNEADDSGWQKPAPVAFGWRPGQTSRRVAGWPGEWRIGPCGMPGTGEAATHDGIAEAILAHPDLQVVPLRMSARLRQRPDGPARRFKNLCQEAGIPVWRRRAMPMLALHGHPVYVAGLGVNRDRALVEAARPSGEGSPRGFVVDYVTDEG